MTGNESVRHDGSLPEKHIRMSLVGDYASSDDDDDTSVPSQPPATTKTGGLMSQLSSLPKPKTAAKPKSKRPKKTTLKDRRKLLLAVPEIPDDLSDDEAKPEEDLKAKIAAADGLGSILPAPKASSGKSMSNATTASLGAAGSGKRSNDALSTSAATGSLGAAGSGKRSSAATTTSGGMVPYTLMKKKRAAQDPEQPASTTAEFFSFDTTSSRAAAPSQAQVQPSSAQARQSTQVASYPQYNAGYQQQQQPQQHQAYGYGQSEPVEYAQHQEYATPDQYEQYLQETETQGMSEQDALLAKLMQQDRHRMGSVNVVEVKDATRRDTFDEWQRKYGDGKNDNRPVKAPNIAGGARHKSQLSNLVGQAVENQDTISRFWAQGHEARRVAKQRYGF